MSKEPLHPIVRPLLGKADEFEIQFLESVLGPLRGPRANLTLISLGLPFALAGAAVVLYDVVSYAAFVFAILMLCVMARIFTRFPKG